jgi:hypothetical protein
MPVYFEVGIPQAFAWTLLNPYIVSCPAENEPIAFQVSFSFTFVCSHIVLSDPDASLLPLLGLPRS